MSLAAQLLALLLFAAASSAADVASATTHYYKPGGRRGREPNCILYSTKPGNKLPPDSDRQVRLSSGVHSCTNCAMACLDNPLCEGAWHKDMTAGLARIGESAASRLLLLNNPCDALSAQGLCPLYAQLTRSYGRSSSPAGGYYSRRDGATSTRGPKASCALFAGSNADASGAVPLAAAGRSNSYHHTYGKPQLPPGSRMTCGDCMARFLTTPQATSYCFAAIPPPPQQPTKAEILAQHQDSVEAAAAWMCRELAGHIEASDACPQAPAGDDVGDSQASCNNIPKQGAQGCPGDASGVEPGSSIKMVTNPRLARQCDSFCACDVRSGSPTYGAIKYVDYCPGPMTEFNPLSRSCELKTSASTCGFVTTPNPSHGLLGVCYDPQHNPEYPLNGGKLGDLAAAIDADFKHMADNGIKFARTYYSSFYGIHVAPAAAKHGVKLHLGVFMFDNAGWYQEQVNVAAQAVKLYPDTVQAILVGNENLQPNGAATADALIAKMAGIRDAVAAAINGSRSSVPPVGTVQRINEWLNEDNNASTLAKAADVIGVNIYTFFSPEVSNDPPNVPAFVSQWGKMVHRHGAAKLRLTETGFPSEGGRANLSTSTSLVYGPDATLPNAQAYFKGVYEWMSVPGTTNGNPAFYFSMYDRRPEDDSGGTALFEKHFGLFTSQRSDKSILT